jgi:hypothetical protein
MPVITKESAEAIARKLGATKDSKKNRPHDLYSREHASKRQYILCRPLDFDKGMPKDSS